MDGFNRKRNIYIPLENKKWIILIYLYFLKETHHDVMMKYIYIYIHTHIYTNIHYKYTHRDLPGGAVVKNPPANAGDTGSSPGPGRSHMPRSN